MHLRKLAKSSRHVELWLVSPPYSEDELGVFVIPHMAPNIDQSYTCDVDVPAVDLLTFRLIDHKALLVCTSVNHLHLAKSNTLFISGCRGHARDHHQLDQLGGLASKLLPLRLLQSIIC